MFCTQGSMNHWELCSRTIFRCVSFSCTRGCLPRYSSRGGMLAPWPSPPSRGMSRCAKSSSSRTGPGVRFPCGAQFCGTMVGMRTSWAGSAGSAGGTMRGLGGTTSCCACAWMSAGMFCTASATFWLTRSASSGCVVRVCASSLRWARSTFFSVRKSTGEEASTSWVACSWVRAVTTCRSIVCAIPTAGE